MMRIANAETRPSLSVKAKFAFNVGHARPTFTGPKRTHHGASIAASPLPDRNTEIQHDAVRLGTRCNEYTIVIATAQETEERRRAFRVRCRSRIPAGCRNFHHEMMFKTMPIKHVRLLARIGKAGNKLIVRLGFERILYQRQHSYQLASTRLNCASAATRVHNGDRQQG